MEIREIEIPVTNQIYLVAKAKRFFVHFNINFKRKSSVNTKKYYTYALSHSRSGKSIEIPNI